MPQLGAIIDEEHDSCDYEHDDGQDEGDPDHDLGQALHEDHPDQRYSGCDAQTNEQQANVLDCISLFFQVYCFLELAPGLVVFGEAVGPHSVYFRVVGVEPDVALLFAEAGSRYAALWAVLDALPVLERVVQVRKVDERVFLAILGLVQDAHMALAVGREVGPLQVAAIEEDAGEDEEDEPEEDPDAAAADVRDPPIQILVSKYIHSMGSYSELSILLWW